MPPPTCFHYGGKLGLKKSYRKQSNTDAKQSITGVFREMLSDFSAFPLIRANFKPFPFPTTAGP